METQRTSRILGERQSVVLGQAPASLYVLDAGEPGEPVIWLPPTRGSGSVKRMSHCVDEDGSISADFIPYAPGDTELVCMVGNDPDRVHTFTIAVETDPAAPKTLRPSAMEPASGIQRSWTSEIPPPPMDETRFSDQEVDDLVGRIGDSVPPPPHRDATMPPMTPERTSEERDTVPSPMTFEGEVPPADIPFSPDERRSIMGSPTWRFFASLPMLGFLTLGFLLLGFGAIALLASPNMNSKEALHEAARHDERLHRDAQKMAETRTPAPARADTPPSYDISCSTTPIQVNPDGTFEMEVCVD